MTKTSELRDWLFRGLMFESEAEVFRSAGIRVGADQKDVERSLLEETLSPFSVDMRNDALAMSRIYALIFCFENSVRRLIAQRLFEQYGADWWAERVASKIREFAGRRQEDAQSNSWLEGQNKDVLSFLEFGHLSDIITNNWDDFSDLIPSQHWLKQRMDELEKARNFIAHNRQLLPSEFRRLEMYVSDWNKMVGL